MRKRAFTKLRKQLIERIDQIKQRFNGASVVKTSDTIDDAFINETIEVESSLAGREAAELAQIKYALAAIDTGKYGICIDCQKNIPMERLEALPYALKCVHCQSTSPQENGYHQAANWSDVDSYKPTEQQVDAKSHNGDNLE